MTTSIALLFNSKTPWEAPSVSTRTQVDTLGKIALQHDKDRLSIPDMLGLPAALSMLSTQVGQPAQCSPTTTHHLIQIVSRFPRRRLPPSCTTITNGCEPYRFVSSVKQPMSRFHSA